MKMNRNKGLLYLQIKEILKDRILHGIYPIYKNIPSEPQLENEFQVSKITIRNAIKELVQEGYLEKRSGKGTKVIANTSVARLSKGKRFTEILVEEGHRIEKKVLSIKKIDLAEGTVPFRLFGNTCLQIDRLFLLDEEPYIYYTHYVWLEVEEEVLADLQVNSLYQLMEANGIKLETFRDEFAVNIPPDYICQTMNLTEPTPLLNRVRFSYDEDGNVIEYSQGYYHTEKQNYIVTYNESGK